MSNGMIHTVGNTLMDAHHQVFFRMVREFSESPDKASLDAMKQRIAFLAEYTAMHLAADGILNMMQPWFVDHILGEDKKYAPYLQQRN